MHCKKKINCSTVNGRITMQNITQSDLDSNWA